MKRQGLVWLIFCLCLLVAFGAMGWISAKVIELDRAQADLRHKERLEDNVRLALWRMDSALAPIVAQENARPASAYRAPVVFIRARNSETIQPVASPLLVQDSPLMSLYFDIAPDGTITSPQVAPDARVRNTIESNFLSPERLDQAQARLTAFRKRDMDPDALAELLPPVKRPMEGEVVLSPGATQQQSLAQGNAQNAGQQRTPTEQSQREYEFRHQILQNRKDARSNSAFTDRDWDRQLIPDGSQPYEGAVRAVWVGNDLLLARRVLIDDFERIQGCVIDWPAARKWLLSLVNQDLLPGADLVPVVGEPPRTQPRMLTQLPARLVAAGVSLPVDESPSPVRTILVVTWVCMLLACGAVAMLLRGVMGLSERRAAFVSAVTHELRTPLTTLRMYTEMLSDGMVGDEARRQSYLATLRGEANRLGHLVENVLGYSRLERKRSAGRLESVALPTLVESVSPRLAERAQQAGMELAIEGLDAVADARVVADPVAVEQILFNLVDNACKYASGAADKRIHLTLATLARHATLCVRDHGPGLGDEQQRKLFRPFSKSVNEAANTAKPGLGLGLALSRRLARDMGGELRPQPTDAGACFSLSLRKTEA